MDDIDPGRRLVQIGKTLWSARVNQKIPYSQRVVVVGAEGTDLRVEIGSNRKSAAVTWHQPSYQMAWRDIGIAVGIGCLPLLFYYWQGEPIEWIHIGIGATLAFLVLFYFYWENRRKKALLRVALMMGFTFYPDMESWFPDRPDIFDFGLFMCEGRMGIETPVLTGSFDSNDVLLFDYKYGGGRQYETSKRQTVACFKLHRTIPSFQLIAKAKKFEIVKAHRPVVSSRIHFDKNPTFSKRYSLYASDANAVGAMFYPNIVNFFERQEDWSVNFFERLGHRIVVLVMHGEREDWSVEAGRGWLLVYRHGSTVNPRQIPGFLDETKRIFMLFTKN